MATIDEYLQTWKLKFITTKTGLAIFHLKKKAKHEPKFNHNNKNLPYCSEPKYLWVTLDRLLTYCQHLESLRKKLTSCVTLLRWLAGSGWGAGATTLGTTTLSLIHSTTEYYTPVWCCSARTHLINPVIITPCELWMLARIGRLCARVGCRHQTCWALLQRSHTVSITPCHGAWKFAPLSAHLGHLLHLVLTCLPCGNARGLKSRHPFVPAAQ